GHEGLQVSHRLLTFGQVSLGLNGGQQTVQSGILVTGQIEALLGGAAVEIREDIRIVRIHPPGHRRRIKRQPAGADWMTEIRALSVRKYLSCHGESCSGSTTWCGTETTVVGPILDPTPMGCVFKTGMACCTRVCNSKTGGPNPRSSVDGSRDS